MMTETQCELEQFTGRIILCQCTMTLYGEKKEIKTCVLRIPKTWQDVQEDSRTDIGRFPGPDQKRIGKGRTRTSRMDNGMMSLRT